MTGSDIDSVNRDLGRLSTDPGFATNSLPIQSPALIRELVSNVNVYPFSRRLHEILNSNWLLKYLDSSDLSDELLETCTLLVQCGIASDLVRHTLREYTHTVFDPKHRKVFDQMLHIQPTEKNSVSPEARNEVTTKSLPDFTDAHSVWLYYYSYALRNSLSVDQWESVYDKTDNLRQLWTQLPNYSYKWAPHTSDRLLILSNDTESFYNVYKGQCTPSLDAIKALKAEATKFNEIFGISLAASSVAFRYNQDSDQLELSRKLDPLETLQNSEEQIRYMALVGADIAILPAITASTLQTINFTHVVFPAKWLEDSKLSFLTMVVLTKCGVVRFGIIEEPSTLPVPLPRGAGLSGISDVKISRQENLQSPEAWIIASRGD